MYQMYYLFKKYKKSVSDVWKQILSCLSLMSFVLLFDMNHPSINLCCCLLYLTEINGPDRAALSCGNRGSGSLMYVFTLIFGKQV